MDPADVEACKRLVADSQGFDWGDLLASAWRQKVLPLVGRNLEIHGIVGGDGWPFVAAYLANRVRSSVMLHELDRILVHLRSRKIPVIVRKGPVLIQSIYGEPGIRRMNDVDLLVGKDHVPGVKDALTEFGYDQGSPAANRRRIEPYRRETRVAWNLYVDNLMPFVRIATDPHVRYHVVDVCRNLFQPKAGYSIPTEGLFERAIPFRVSAGTALQLSAEDFLIDLCAHLHKESTTLTYIEQGADLQLSKFLDVAEYCQRIAFDQATFIGTVRRHGLEEPMYFSLCLTDRIYPGSIPPEMLAALRPADEACLDIYGQSEGQAHKWNADFLTRLFDPWRARQAEGKSWLPK
jgi:hypothetical protein